MDIKVKYLIPYPPKYEAQCNLCLLKLFSSSKKDFKKHLSNHKNTCGQQYSKKPKITFTILKI